jgi:hypothetical protein
MELGTYIEFRCEELLVEEMSSVTVVPLVHVN